MRWPTMAPASARLPTAMTSMSWMVTPPSWSAAMALGGEVFGLEAAASALGARAAAVEVKRAGLPARLGAEMRLWFEHRAFDNRKAGHEFERSPPGRRTPRR